MDTELDIQQFFQEVASICALEQAQQEERNRKGENYNLFSILNIERYELKHSALIANLLDPKGSHGCGDAFLRAFFEIALKGTAYPFESSTPLDSRTEHYTGPIAGDTGGRIDILVKSSHYGLIIENKIYAGDQDKQLIRYDNYGKEIFGADGYLLVYLTLYGYDASKESTATKSAEEVGYLRLSYAEDILRWLEQCARLAYDKPLVRESLNQYIRTIKQLTYQDMNEENIQQIIDLAIDHPEVVATLSSKRDAIAEGIREKYIFDKLKEYADQKGWLYDDSESSYNEEEPKIRFRKEGWDGSIIISADSENKKSNYGWWMNLWIGIDSKVTGAKKLACLEKQSPEYPMGWEYLTTPNWYSAENFPAMKTSVAEEIINKLNEIIEELGVK
ncbi:MAG: PD-(D/E)XK nuclease family protein [Porphyromonas sp.]|uniref:PDDEXK-like family protein n=1 Tax=Porphyromonas sp. TaxID=1924944 RepID=UPI001CAF2A44|nr:PD-(D/E)XK nuclease family protein [Porphyromonas sp.]MBF1406181.1 PD-(D/E)XK nuclease family protein [Porphyromonas sp.]